VAELDDDLAVEVDALARARAVVGPPVPHYFVAGPVEHERLAGRRVVAERCARPRCGRGWDDPVHITPPPGWP
jgi:hypothetical protein